MGALRASEADLSVPPDLTQWCRDYPHAWINWNHGKGRRRRKGDGLGDKWDAIADVCKQKGLTGKDRARMHAFGHLRLLGVSQTAVQVHTVSGSSMDVHYRVGRPLHMVPQMIFRVRMTTSPAGRGRMTKYVGYVTYEAFANLPRLSLSGKKGSPLHYFLSLNDPYEEGLPLGV